MAVDMNSTTVMANINMTVTTLATMTANSLSTLTTDSLTTASTFEEDDCLRPEKGDFVPWANPQNIITKKQEEIITVFVAAGAIPALFIIGTVGNVLSAIVFYRQSLNIRVNVCLFSLALADQATVTVLFFSYFEADYRMFVGPSNIFIKYCIGLTGFTWVSQFLSVLIASERCFCVCFPLKAQRVLSARKMAIFIGVTSFVLFGGLVAIAGHKHIMHCLVDPFTNQTVDIVYVTQYYLDNQKILDIFDVFVYSTFFPLFFLVVITVTSAVTAVKLTAAREWRKSTVYAMSHSDKDNGKRGVDGQKSNSSSGGGGQASVTAKEAAVTKMLLATSLLFIACLIPTIMVQISTFLVSELRYNGRYHNFITALWALVSLCRVLNSSLNFFVYYAMGSKFRDTLRSVFPRCCCKGSTPANAHSMTTISEAVSTN